MKKKSKTTRTLKPKATTVAVPATVRGLWKVEYHQSSMGASVFYKPKDISTRVLIGENGDIGHGDQVLTMLNGLGEGYLYGAELEISVKVLKKGKPKLNPFTKRVE